MRNQIFHIFRKDVRYLWREILLSLAMSIAYSWRETIRLTTPGFGINDFSFLSMTMWLLVFAAWGFTVVRAFQAECLVGDRQFWVTRPYEWKRLFVAKLLFVLVFFNVPLFIVQTYLLRMAGFSLNSNIQALLVFQSVWTLVVIVPSVTMATVTAGIGQFLLAMLGVFLYFFAVMELVSQVPAAQVYGAWSIPDGTILVCASVSVVLWQFARRRTLQSRVLLLGIAVLLPIIMVAMPHRRLIERAYPKAVPGQSLPVQLALDPSPLASREGGHPEENKVHVRIPLLVSGVATGLDVVVQGAMESIQAPGGLEWNSGWHDSDGRLLPDRQHHQADIMIDKDFFDRVKSSPARVRVTFALAPSRARKTLQVIVQAGQFTLPAGGRCLFAPLPSEITCLFPPIAHPPFVSVRSDEMTCPPRKNETALPSGTILYGGFTPAGSGMINPVEFATLSLTDWGESNSRDLRPRVCPGTPLTIYANWEGLPRYRTEIEIDGIRLADYQLTDRSVDGGAPGIAVP